MEIRKCETSTFIFLKYSILALMPVLSIYDGISFVNLGELLLLLIMIIEIIMNRGSFDINSELLILITFLAVMNIINGFTYMNIIDFTGYWHNSIDMILTAVIYAYFVKSTIVNKQLFYQYLKAVALACSLFIFIQCYFYYKGTVIYGFLPFLNIDELKEYGAISISYGRPNSFFLEPAHFAIYVLPVYVISLIKKQYITSCILLIGLFLSTSSTGIIIALIVSAIYYINEKDNPVIVKWIFAIIAFLIIIRILPYINQSSAIKKISLSSLKRNIRILGTLPYFYYFNIKEMLLGVGINEISAYIGIYANLDISNYSNSLFYSFFSFGIVGGVIWNAYIIGLFKFCQNKYLLLVFIFVYLSDQILFDNILIYLLLILHIFSNAKD